MAHGPVNKAWYVRLADGVTFKINEDTYDKIRDEHPDAIISVLVGSRTDRCIHLWDGAVETLKDEGYEHKNGNVYGKMTVEFEFTA